MPSHCAHQVITASARRQWHAKPPAELSTANAADWQQLRTMPTSQPHTTNTRRPRNATSCGEGKERLHSSPWLRKVLSNNALLTMLVEPCVKIVGFNEFIPHIRIAARPYLSSPAQSVEHNIVSFALQPAWRRRADAVGKNIAFDASAPVIFA